MTCKVTILRERRSRPWAEAGAGFTLIELLVVIAIIGIMAAISVPAVRGLTQGNNRVQAVNVVRAYVSQARSIAVSQHRQAGVVLFEETKNYASPVHGNEVAMQIFVESYDQQGVLEGNTLYVAYSTARAYLPAGIRVAALNDDASRGVMTGEEASATVGKTRAILFDANGQMITRHGMARPDLGGAAGTYPQAYGDWHFTTKRGGANVGVSSPGLFLFDMNEYAAKNIPTDHSGDAARNIWIKQHADVVMINANTGNFVQ